MARRFRRAEVEWIDSAMRSGWGDGADYDSAGPILCRSIGYVYRNDDEAVVLLQSHSDHEGLAVTMSIPRVAVRKFRYLHGGLD